MHRVLVFVGLCFMLSPAQAEKPLAPERIDGAKRVSAEQAIEVILSTPGVVIVDSRRHSEYTKGHIEGAVSLLNTEMTPQALARYVPTKKTPVLFYCNGERCARSTDAVTRAVDWGYSKVFWFRGGWNEWRDKGFPISR